ncbi:DUF1294 domain-containing protein [Neobittarella massiliensis]|uniref:DUF1294 domain-containing protein n=1 Tax=Neobittarella massiliensis (ex Bilen et al. 2018) TaxID=2041842 RepID=A0A8J6LYB1_9FIRM|nr:DUF1294 domain-containing protein [Neobittarella massiliensis]MBC3515147.1 DUF1294 domain-containing protein [Neobittarella massiliensis]
MQTVLTAYLVAVNLAGLLLCATDKYRAKKGRWRIPEHTLMSVAALGGCFGLYLGMKACHHKTRHPKFYVGVPLLCLMWAAVVGLAWWNGWL